MNLPSDPLVGSIGSSPLFSPISVPSHTSIDFLHALPLDNPLAARVGVARRSVSLGDPKNLTNDPQPKNPHQGTCWRLPLHWFHTATAATLFIIATAAISATASWLWLTDREQPPHIVEPISDIETLPRLFCKKTCNHKFSTFTFPLLPLFQLLVIRIRNILTTDGSSSQGTKPDRNILIKWHWLPTSLL